LDEAGPTDDEDPVGERRNAEEVLEPDRVGADGLRPIIDRDHPTTAPDRGQDVAVTGRGHERPGDRIDELPAVEFETADPAAIGDDVHGVAGGAAGRERLGEYERSGVRRLGR
jgi:hypothetical protein